jgi:streptogramin lyase
LPVDIDGAQSAVSVSCISATVCVAVDHQGYLITYDGGWGIPTTPIPFTNPSGSAVAISCVPSADSIATCTTIDAQGNNMVTKLQVSAPSNVDMPTLSSNSVAVGTPVWLSPGSWSGEPAPTFTYQWYDCTPAGSCTPISGATGINYTPTNSDGNMELKAVVTATNSQGTASLGTTQSNMVPGAPYNNSSPSITPFAPVVGSQLTVSNGSWAGSAITYTYQWENCDNSGNNCSPIAGATTNTYTTDLSNYEDELKVIFTATNSLGQVVMTIGPTSPVLRAPSGNAAYNVIAPSISGVIQDHQTLTANTGAWLNTPVGFTSYQWQRLTSDPTTCNTSNSSWQNISGANNSTYTTVDSDTGCSLRVLVVEDNTGLVQNGGAGFNYSLPTAPIAAANGVPAVPVAVSGATTVGQVLTTTTGSYPGGSSYTYTYAWQRDSSSAIACNTSGRLSWKNIAGATSSTYSLQHADAGCSVRSVVTAARNFTEYSTPGNSVAQNIVAGPDGDLYFVGNGGIEKVSPDGDFTSVLTFANFAQPGQDAVVDPYGNVVFSAPANCGGCSNPGDIGELTSVNSRNYAVPSLSIPNSAGPSDTQTITEGPDGNVWFTEPFSHKIGKIVTATIPGANTGTITEYSAGLSGPDGITTDANGKIWFTDPGNNAIGTITANGVVTEHVIPLSGAWPSSITAGSNGNLWFTEPAGAFGNSVNSAIGEMTPSGSFSQFSLSCCTNSNISPTSEIVNGPDNTLWVSMTDGSIQNISANGVFNNSYTPPGGANGLAAGTDGNLWFTTNNGKVGFMSTNPAPQTVVSDSPATPAITEPPANTVAPKLSTDNPVVGGPLTVSNGTWTGYEAPTFTYQWEDCSSAQLCSPILGATSQTYTPVSSDDGLDLQAVVTATNSAGNASANSELSNAVVEVPANVVAPVLSTDSPVVETPLSVSNGTWTGYPAPTFTYQWTRCNSAGQACSPVAGATAQTYTPLPTDVGFEFEATVTATNSAGNASANSEMSNPVADIAPTSTAPPVITGAPVDGQTLTTSNGVFTGFNLSYTYQWQESSNGGVSWQDLTGATSNTYVLQDSDVGNILRSEVTATNTAGSATGTSAPTPPIAQAPSINGPRLSTDDPVFGQTLSVSNGTVAGSPAPTFTYQWEQCNPTGTNCIAISGATSQTYTPVAGDIGQTLQAIVTATNNLNTSSAASEISNPVLGPPVNIVPPVEKADLSVSEEPAVLIPEPTKTMGSQPGTWTNNPTGFSYQWEQCDATGNNCSAIAGATTATYRPTIAQIGDTLVLQVSATNAAGTGVASSPPSNAISEAPINTVPPVLSTDNPTVGNQLSVSNGTWIGFPTPTFTYQWMLCNTAGQSCSAIDGATSQTYTPVASDAGARLEATVTATNDAGTASANSEISNPIPSIPGQITPPTVNVPPTQQQPVLVVTPPCTIHSIVLTGVYRQGNRVRLYGVTGSALDGQTIHILFGSSRKIVATTTVGSDGLFFAWAKIPAKSLRGTNGARYRAVSGKYASMFLKLSRRTIVASTTVGATTLTFQGHLVAPVARKHAEIEVSAQTNCGAFQVVKTEIIKKNGRFFIQVPAPAAGVVTIYRLSGEVPENKHSKRMFATFSLPVVLNLAAKEPGVKSAP